MNDTFDMTLLEADLTTDEGIRYKPYVDTTGNLTIGVGRNLTVNGITVGEMNLMLTNDIGMAVAGLDAHLSWWRDLDQPRQRVMINLAFNMGVNELETFGTFLSLMQAKNYDGAANDLAGTLWYGQVGQRGARMIARLRQP